MKAPTLEDLQALCHAEGILVAPDELSRLAAALAKGKQPAGASAFIARWCELWSEKYDDKAPVSGKAAGVAKRVVKDLGLPRALELLERYFTMQDSWFAQRRHDLVTFESSLTAVASGKTVTRSQIQQGERRSNVQGQLERIRKGTL